MLTPKPNARAPKHSKRPSIPQPFICDIRLPRRLPVSTDPILCLATALRRSLPFLIEECRIARHCAQVACESALEALAKGGRP